MLTAAFPPGKLDGLAWFALVPLLKAIDKQAPSRAFILGFTAGLAHYFTLIYWVVVVLKRYGELNALISVSALALLTFYLSFYPAFFSCLLRHHRLKGYPAALFMGASLWVSLEYVRAKAFTGFPWCLLGYTQFKNLSLIQIADLTGVYGVSFLVALSNFAIFFLFFRRNTDRAPGLRWQIPCVILMFALTFLYGHQNLKGDNGNAEEQKIIPATIIQANIDQSVKWDPAYQSKTLDLYEALTGQTADFGPTLIVWPETAVPFFAQDVSELSIRLGEIAGASGAHFILGSPAYVKDDHGIRYHNRAYYLSPERGFSDYYDKVHLVPFGEYVPLKRLLPFIHRLVPAAGDFEPGKDLSPLKLPFLSAGVIICFEAIFPELSRRLVKENAEILVNLTNDAWFGATSAPYQHLSMAIFRAVENGRPMLRAANTGFSAFIESSGKIIVRSRLFTEGILRKRLVVQAGPLRFYTRHGDVFSGALLIMNLIICLHMLYYSARTKTRKFSQVQGR
jgi:apolipoprotein N-acyltransferase